MYEQRYRVVVDFVTADGVRIRRTVELRARYRAEAEYRAPKVAVPATATVVNVEARKVR